METAVAILGGVCALLGLLVVILLSLYCGAIRKLEDATNQIACTSKSYVEASEGWGHALRRNGELQREYTKVLENWKALTGYADQLRGLEAVEEDE